MDTQYFPTPRALAIRAWQMFQSHNFSRVLEPSAGQGHLASVTRDAIGQRVRIDALEIDLAHHAALRDEVDEIVGTDFLEFQEGGFYSHVIMNPPFAQGARHVLHAWDILWSGEIVAILNAETIRNPFSQERQLLVRLIEEHGRVEFVERPFTRSVNPDVEREADVDVALVWLKKPAPADGYTAEAIERVLAGLREDGRDARRERFDIGDRDLALPLDLVEDAVLRFNAAVQAAKEAVEAEARARNFAARMLPAAMRGGNEANPVTPQEVQALWHERYTKLRGQAWYAILRSTKVSSKLSSSARQRLEAEFERVQRMAFTERNIYAFLQGLSESAWDIQIGMLCDVFDAITRYTSDNAVFYMGWKSNDRHVTQARRIKTTRFVLPGFECPGWRKSLDFQEAQQLDDIDKVFAMLDGKQKPDAGLVDAFTNPRVFADLRAGKRVSLSYFDVRYYPGRGTIHFFPTRKDLVDRLNRLVGQHRRWLPDEPSQAGEDFWRQYREAEKYADDLREAFTQAASQIAGRLHWTLSPDSLTRRDFVKGADARQQQAAQAMQQALEATLQARGYDVQALCLHVESRQLRLAA